MHTEAIRKKSEVEYVAALGAPETDKWKRINEAPWKTQATRRQITCNTT